MALRRLLVARALTGAEHLPADQRAILFDAISVTLDGKEAEEAKIAAFAVREAEKHQLTLFALLNPSHPTTNGKDGAS